MPASVVPAKSAIVSPGPVLVSVWLDEPVDALDWVLVLGVEVAAEVDVVAVWCELDDELEALFLELDPEAVDVLDVGGLDVDDDFGGVD